MNGSPTDLYFTAGPNDENDGLFGKISAAAAEQRGNSEQKSADIWTEAWLAPSDSSVTLGRLFKSSAPHDCWVWIGFVLTPFATFAPRSSEDFYSVNGAVSTVVSGWDEKPDLRRMLKAPELSTCSKHRR